MAATPGATDGAGSTGSVDTTDMSGIAAEWNTINRNVIAAQLALDKATLGVKAAKSRAGNGA